MFHLLGRKGRGLGQARKLVTDLPLVMYVLDLDGHTPAKTSRTVTLEELSSLPMQVLWQGMSDPRISWDSSQHHVDWEEFDQVSGGIFSLDSRLLASYAIVSREYLHLNIRFGYHFSIVDAICGEQSSTNYVNFRLRVAVRLISKKFSASNSSTRSSHSSVLRPPCGVICSMPLLPGPLWPKPNSPSPAWACCLPQPD